MSDNSYDNLIQVIYEKSGYPSDFCLSSDNERVKLAVESINHDRMADEIAELRKENNKLKAMIDNGLGWEDMKGGTIQDVS